jgi:ribulose-phosphate 3-epimerase
MPDRSTQAFSLLKANAPTISVGILSGDLMHLSSELALLERTDIHAVHFDVMDGCFVPVMTAGPPLIKAVKTPLLKDVHLMIQDPLAKVGDYVEAGADMITVHVESCDDVLPVLRHLATMENRNDPGRGLVRGVACNPNTPVNLLQPLLDDVEMIVVLAVDIMVKGFPFYSSIGQKVAEVREMMSDVRENMLLCVDGGVKKNNINEIAAMRADIVVSGSAILDGKDPVENARFMLNALRSQE